MSASIAVESTAARATAAAYWGALTPRYSVRCDMVVDSLRYGRASVQAAKHRRLASFLHEECGLVSAYHAHRNVAYGDGGEVPTYRHLRKAALQWHIDYCFMPAAWRKRLTRARVVEGEHWLTRSDHSPVVVDLAD